MIGISGSGIGPGVGTVNANVYAGPPMTMIQWPAESNDVTLAWYSASGFNNYFPSNSNYAFRKPTQWTNGQCMNTGANSPIVVVQDVVDNDLAAYKNAIDGWAFDWYPPDALLAPADKTSVSKIMQYHDAYQTSVLKHASGIKFAYMLQWFWYNYVSGTYRSAFNAWLNTMMADSMYQQVNGSRLLLLYNDAGASGWAGNLAAWNQLKTDVGGNIFGVSVNSVSMLQNLGLQAIVTYGPNSALPSGSAEDPYTAQQARDFTASSGAVPGAMKATSFTPVQDRRPFSPATRWVDLPSRPQLAAAFTQFQAIVGTKFWYIYARSEITEGGNPDDCGFPDVAKWKRGFTKPQTYTYELTAKSAGVSGNNLVILSGVWTYVQGIIGCFKSEIIRTSALGPTATLQNHDNLLSCDIVGNTAPGYGTATVLLDGISVGIANFNGASAVHQTLFTVTPGGAPAAHSVQLAPNGDGQIDFNCFRPTYKP